MLPQGPQKVQIELSSAAFDQIKLIQENDFTLDGHKFRLKINGKECDGFRYQTGFSLPHEEDITLCFKNDKDIEIEMIVDPFTAYYCQKGSLNFIFEPENELEGFVFTNNNEKQYRGKFFKDESKVPKDFKL